LEDLDRAAQRVCDGDAAAFELLVASTSAVLVRLSARILGSVADAEDVVQESYVKAYRALTAGQFDARSSVKTWLHRIVTHASIDALRARARRPTTEDHFDDSLGWDAAAQTEARVALAELAHWLDQLPPEQRAAIVLKSVEGLSSGEVAEMLGSTEGAVEQLLVRARSTLRQKRSAS
jgi:RNA polymerase sigma-70 factor, ECF subfamily